MSTEQAFRDHELRTINPPDYDAPDEPCGDDPTHTLDADSWQVDGVLMCSGCLRHRLVTHYSRARARVLDEYPYDVLQAERCDQCGLLRCACGDDDDR